MAILKVHIKFTFTGAEMAKARDSLGLTQAEFAKKCGWTQQNQAILELPGLEHRLNFDKKAAFERAGIVEFDSKP